MFSRLGSSIKSNNKFITPPRVRSNIILNATASSSSSSSVSHSMYNKRRWLSMLVLLEPRILNSAAVGGASAFVPHCSYSTFSSSSHRRSFAFRSNIHCHQPCNNNNNNSSSSNSNNNNNSNIVTSLSTRAMSTVTSNTNRSMKQDALQIIHKSIQAVDPYAAVKAHLRLVDDTLLRVGEEKDTATATKSYYNIKEYDKIVVIAFGKASSAMATAVVQQLSDTTTSTTTTTTTTTSSSKEQRPQETMGVCICKDGHATKEEISTLEAFHCSVLEASHPVPDERSAFAAQQALEMVQQHASPQTMVICCISGGGSALFCKPQVGLTLHDLQETNEALLDSGMTIQDMNVIRKRLEQGKGGRLARACHPSQLITLVLSDVLGDPLDLIASGPTVPDTSTPKDALEIVKRYQLEDKLPNQVMAVLEQEVLASKDGNPSSDHPVFAQAQTVLVGNNALAVQAAAQEAKELGYHPVVLGTQIEGEAKEIAKMYTRMALHLKKDGESSSSPSSSSTTMLYSMAPSLPVALIAGGETTVSLESSMGSIGKGGRNQELALSAALDLQSLGLENVVLASAGTDGTDGPTDAAGAMVDAHTITSGDEGTLEEARKALDNHDAYPFLDALGNGKERPEDRPLIKTGPTGTNVADVCVTLIR
ncbi:unnamed protein product [Cylindrotheca closterium]|uniref:Glycerate kinase n=1 Tax=Cylindrotheca closterium TaxID=2856 RepID=A0AAD2PTX3_9STRA|nr:unnamed protein product [Cylindrotheca closterium]